MTAILEVLMRVADREELDPVLHFGSKANHMALHLDKSGGMIKFEHETLRPIRVPWPVTRTRGLLPNILFDSPKYILVVGEARDASCALHRSLAAHAEQDPALEAVLDFFAKPPPSIGEITKKQAQLDIVFYFDGLPICERPGLRGAIGKVMRSRSVSVGKPSRFDDSKECLLDMHSKISFVGLDNPQALLSFNQDVSWSSGNGGDSRMLHAPMSYECMRKYTSGLEWLRLNRSLPIPSLNGGGALHYLAWTETPHRIEPLLQRVLAGCEKGSTMKDWNEWLRQHLDADEELFFDNTTVNILSLHCGSRIAVRGLHQISVGELAKNLVAHLDGFSFLRDNKLYRYGHSIYSIINAMPSVTATVSVVERLVNAILLRRHYPAEFMSACLRAYVEASSSGLDDAGAESMLRAISNRQSPELNISIDSEMKFSEMPPGIREQAFIAGMMFCVLESRNNAAKDPGDSNTVSRYLRQACSDPASTFHRLNVLSESHAQKLESKFRYSYRSDTANLEEMLSNVGGLPGRLSNVEKTFFIRGREYQMHLFRARMRKAKETASEN